MHWFFHKKRDHQADEPAGRKQTIFSGGNARRYLENSDYILPKDQAEEIRLNFQHYALYQAIGSHYIAPISQSIRLILDVGTGTGIWPIEMAQLFPHTEVIGVDLDTKLFKPEMQKNCILREGDVLKGLPFPDAFFSYTHQRLLTAAIPAAKWPGVIHELIRVTRPGGWIELVEIDNHMQHAGPANTRLRTLVEAVSQSLGFDGEVIRHLGTLLMQEGLQSVKMQPIFIPVGDWGGRVGSMMKKDLLAVMHTVKDLYCAHSGITPEAYDALLLAVADEWEEYHSSCTFLAAYGKRVQT